MTYAELYKLAKKHGLLNQQVVLCVGNEQDLLPLVATMTDSFTHPHLVGEHLILNPTVDGEESPQQLRVIDPLVVDYYHMNNPKGY